MDEALKKAITERIELGYSHEEITHELRSAGYDDETIKTVLVSFIPHAHNDIPPAHHIEQVDSSPSSTLPSASTLFSNGWAFLLERTDLLLWVTIPTLLFSGAEWYFISSGETDEAGIILFLVGIGTFFLSLFVYASVCYTVVQDSKEVTLEEAFAWSRTHFISYLWITILTSLVIAGGFLLFIIPGIILAVYVALATYVLAGQDVRGFKALLISRDLVRGHWWAVAGRMLVLGLMIFGVVFLVTFISSLVFGETGDTTLGTGILYLLLSVVSAGTTLIFFHAMATVYRTLSGNTVIRQAEEDTPKNGKGMLVAVAIVGLSFPLLILVAVLLGWGEAIEEEVFSTRDVLELQAELASLQTTAEAYQSETGSLAGVCEQLQTEVSVASAVLCNDEAEAWAITARLGTDRWCTDSSGELLRIERSLEERTSCLALPAE